MSKYELLQHIEELNSNTGKNVFTANELASDLDKSERAVRRCLKVLIEDHHLERVVIHAPGGKQGLRVEYRLANKHAQAIGGIIGKLRSIILR